MTAQYLYSIGCGRVAPVSNYTEGAPGPLPAAAQ